jgi:hypothetical protein
VAGLRAHPAYSVLVAILVTGHVNMARAPAPSAQAVVTAAREAVSNRGRCVDVGSTLAPRSSHRGNLHAAAGWVRAASFMTVARTPYTVAQASFISDVKAGPRPFSKVHSNAAPTVS